MTLLLILPAWILMLVLVVGLCAAARLGDSAPAVVELGEIGARSDVAATAVTQLPGAGPITARRGASETVSPRLHAGGIAA